jgi:hypothetical protein
MDVWFGIVVLIFTDLTWRASYDSVDIAASIFAENVTLRPPYQSVLQYRPSPKTLRSLRHMIQSLLQPLVLRKKLRSMHYVIQSVLRTRYSLEALRSMHRRIQSVLQPRSLPETIRTEIVSVPLKV